MVIFLFANWSLTWDTFLTVEMEPGPSESGKCSPTRPSLQALDHFTSNLLFPVYFISSYFTLYMSLSILDVWFSLAQCALRYKIVKVAVKHAIFCISTIYMLLVNREGSQWISQSFPTFPVLRGRVVLLRSSSSWTLGFSFGNSIPFSFSSSQRPYTFSSSPPPPSLYNPKCLTPQHTLSPLYFRLSGL